MIAIICVELEYLFQNTKMYFWFYLWPLYHYIIYIKQIISSCTLPGTWMAKSFYILCTLKSILGELDKTELLLDQFLLCFHSNYQNKSGSKTVLRQELFWNNLKKNHPTLMIVKIWRVKHLTTCPMIKDVIIKYVG